MVRYPSGTYVVPADNRIIDIHRQGNGKAIMWHVKSSILENHTLN